MSETESLASILAPANSQAPISAPAEPAKAETPTETKAEPAVADTADTSRDDKGRFAKAETKAEAPKVEAPKQERMVPLSALLAERAKARHTEAPKAEPRVSVFDDEDKGIGQRVDERVNPLRDEFVELKGQFIESMRGVLKGIHTDYDEAEKAFLTAAQGDRALADQWWKSPNPAQFAYEAGKLRMQLEAAGGDITKIGEVQTAKVREELKAEQEKFKALQAENEQLRSQLQNLAAIPTSLNKTPSATPASIAEADDDAIGNLVRFGNKRR